MGRYLEPNIDMGPALTAKILKENGQVVHGFTYRAFTADEWEVSISGMLSPIRTVDDSENLDANTPCHESYYDDNIMTQALNEEADSVQVREQLPE